MAPAKVGMLGTGQVGVALAAPLLRAGHSVQYGSRDPKAAKVQELLKKQPGATAATWPDVIAASDVLILVTPGVREPADYKKLAAQLGPGIKGKVLLDATNPMTPYPELDVLWNGTSGGELLQEAVPDALVFKAFNTVGVEVLGNGGGATVLPDPKAAGPLLAPLTMMYAGPDRGREVAEEVIRGVGFRPEHVGPIRYARNLEAIAELWTHLCSEGIGHSKHAWNRSFHFQVVRKD